jgi:hypothetical protein
VDTLIQPGPALLFLPVSVSEFFAALRDSSVRLIGRSAILTPGPG